MSTNRNFGICQGCRSPASCGRATWPPGERFASLRSAGALTPVVQAFATYHKIHKDCSRMLEPEKVESSNVQMIFPYGFHILFKWLFYMFSIMIPFIYNIIYKSGVVCYTHFQRCCCCCCSFTYVLLFSFPRCARLTSSTMRHNEKSKSVETQRFQVPGTLTHVPNKVTTRLQPPVPLNHFPKWLRNSGNLVTTITIASVLRRLAEAEGLKRAEEEFQLILSEYHVMCVSSWVGTVLKNCPSTTLTTSATTAKQWKWNMFFKIYIAKPTSSAWSSDHQSNNLNPKTSWFWGLSQNPRSDKMVSVGM